jgi:hypothetical protein
MTWCVTSFRSVVPVPMAKDLAEELAVNNYPVSATANE